MMKGLSSKCRNNAIMKKMDGRTDIVYTWKERADSLQDTRTELVRLLLLLRWGGDKLDVSSLQMLLVTNAPTHGKQPKRRSLVTCIRDSCVGNIFLSLSCCCLVARTNESLLFPLLFFLSFGSCRFSLWLWRVPGKTTSDVAALALPFNQSVSSAVLCHKLLLVFVFFLFSFFFFCLFLNHCCETEREKEKKRRKNHDGKRLEGLTCCTKDLGVDHLGSTSSFVVG